jgi:chromosomal replication initiator protein
MTITNTFESFITGESNKFAKFSAEAVSEDTETLYNPLLIFGKYGLGKTHLLHAISANILQKHPDKKVLYINTQDFFDEYISSIQNKTREEFNKKFENNFSVLLLDDIHLLAGKHHSQEALLSILIKAIKNKNQVVVTANTSLEEIEGLDEKIISILMGGLTCCIGKLSIETMVKIIEHKLGDTNLAVSENTFLRLAGLVKGDIRQIEGLVTKIKAYSKMLDQTITDELIDKLYFNLPLQ